MDKLKFNNTFINNEHFNNKLTLVYKDKNEIVGFINGVINPLNTKKGHITCLVLDGKNQRNKIGTKLLNKLESIFIDIGVEYIREIFFNPINLSWYIPNTNNHDHPNAPGIEFNSQFYLFLLNNGYNIDGDIQDVYYLNLQNYVMSKKTK